MKKVALYIVICLFSAINVNCQEASELDDVFFIDLVTSKISIEKEKVVSDTLEKVFTGTFYRVKAGFSEMGGITYCSENIYVDKDGLIIEFDSRTDSMFTLVSLLKNDFYIKTDADAKIFETALDKIYPINWSNEEYKEHLKLNNKWYFIRGEFFDAKSGYIISLDKNSKITNIAYDMEAIKK